MSSSLDGNRSADRPADEVTDTQPGVRRPGAAPQASAASCSRMTVVFLAWYLLYVIAR